MGRLGDGLTHTQIVWSLIYWGIWLVLFLVPEVLGLERVVPWVTLSETVGWLERGRLLLADLVCAFVVGVAIHWRFDTRFGRTELVALALGALLFGTRFV